MASVHLDAEQADPRSIIVLLVDDQPIVGEAIRGMLADTPNLTFHYCEDAARAIEFADRVGPTVILQDLVMPEIDGLLLLRFFRAHKPTRDTPMIVLSSKEDPVIKAEAFRLGANDYLVKLPDARELVARVKYHSRAYLNLVERNEAFRALAEARDRMAAELAHAARYVRSLLPAPLSGRVTVEWTFVPSTQLAGDMFGYHWLDAEHFVVYLLDVSGHGVGSALLAVSAGNLLATESLPGVDFKDPGRVLTALNEVFQMEKQNEKYFTIWYGVYHAPMRRLRYSSAGHPAPLVLCGADRPRGLEMSSFAIGMVPDTEYETAEMELAAGARLLVFSDGAFEVDMAGGGMWPAEDFQTFVAGLPADGGIAGPLLEHVRRLHGSDVLADDFSMLDIRF